MPWYYVDSALNSDGLSNEPMRTHFRNLQTALASVAPALLAYPAQVHQQVNVSWCPATSCTTWTVTGSQYAFQYGAWGTPTSATFLENDGSAGVVRWQGRNYSTSGGVLLLNSSGDVIFDSNNPPVPATARSWSTLNGNASFEWASWSEAPAVSMPATAARAPAGPSTIGAVFVNPTPFEQLNLTQDDTEMLLYSTSVPAAVLAREAAAAVALGASGPLLVLKASFSQAAIVFIGAVAAGTFYDISEAAGSRSNNVTLNASAVAHALASVPHGGTVALTIVTESLGIHKGAGVTNGPTPDTFATNALQGITSSKPRSVVLGASDLTANGWTMTVGMVGELKRVWTAAGGASVNWTAPGAAVPAPLSWYRTTFTAPPLGLLRRELGGAEVSAALHLAPQGFSRGRFYVNDYEISRLWTKNCGSGPCQPYFYIPPDVLLPGTGANRLTVLDMEGPTDLTTPRLMLATIGVPPPPPPCPNSPVVGANVTMSQCRNATGLEWTVRSLSKGSNSAQLFLSALPNICLGVSGTNNVTGAPNLALQICSPSGSAGDTFTPSVATLSGSPGPIVHTASGNCVDNAKQDSSFGARLDTWACNGGSNQAFALTAGGKLVSPLNSMACVGVC